MSVRFHDGFCGAGGSTQGAIDAGAIPVVGLNHWKVACESYAENHAPHGADVMCADVCSIDPRRLPRAEMGLFSPECTHHSYARGRPKDDPSLFDPDGDQAAERSRATMWDVPRFAEAHDYRIIIVENVEPAVKWGLPRGRKLAHGAYGPLFAAWLNAMAALDYHHELVHLNSLVCGVPQSRDRLYVVFWKRGQRQPDLNIPALARCPRCEVLVYAEQRMKRAGATTGILGKQYVYACPTCASACDLAVRPAATAIDWTLEAMMVGDRPVPLRPATIERMRRGLLRLRERPPMLRLANGMVVQGVVLPTTHTDASQRGRVASIDVLPAQTARQEQALVLSNMTNNVPRLADDEAMATVTSGGKLALIYAGRDNAIPRLADAEPAHTLTAINSLYVLDADSMVVEHRGTADRPGGGNQARDPHTEAIGTVSAQGTHHALVIANYGSAGGRAGKQGWSRHVDDAPVGTVTATDSHALFTYRAGVDARGDDEPLTTVSTHQTHALLGDVTQDEIDRCTFRMLQPHELKRASGFPDDYVLHGRKRDQVCQVGNAVTAPTEAELVRRAIASIDEAGS